MSRKGGSDETNLLDDALHTLQKERYNDVMTAQQ